MLLNVLLVDDNKFALSHFAGLVEWKRLGFRLMETAIDGIEAWEKFKRFHPEVVITDVQMPGMDGIELAGKIKESSPETVVIFLSSYDEFDYARAAIDLSVEDYLLKQELDQEILEKKLTEIREQYQKRRARKEKLAKGHLISAFRMPMEETDMEFLQEFFPGTYGFFMLEQDHLPRWLCEMSGMATKELDYRHLLPEIQQNHPEVLYLVRYEPYRTVALISKEENVEALAAEIRKELMQMSGSSISLYLYRGGLDFSGCRQEYEKNRFLFEQRYFEGENAILAADIFEPSGHHCEPAAIGEFRESLKVSGEEAVLCIDRLFRPLLHRYDFTGSMESLRLIIQELKSTCEKKGLPDSWLFDDEVYHLLSIRRMIRWIKSKVMDIKDDVVSCQSENIARAVSYIARRYSDAMLSVEEIAKEAGLSVNRLNDAFKKELGETTGRFLTRKRMEKAKEFLEETDETVFSIAEKAGYNSASYFSHVFRKTYNISPQEYQAKARKKYKIITSK